MPKMGIAENDGLRAGPEVLHLSARLLSFHKRGLNARLPSIEKTDTYDPGQNRTKSDRIWYIFS